MKNITNNNFNIAIGGTFAPFIATKIIKEFTYSHQYEEPIQNCSGSFVYILSSSNPNSVQKNYFVNSMTNHCTCLKSIYRGWPCRHLFRIWKALNQDLISNAVSFTHSHWKLNSQNNFVTYCTSSTLRREIIISPRKELPLGIHDIQISYTQKKSKKRKAEILGDSEEESKQLKMSKLNETVIFELMRTHSNSCRFDCALAALYFIQKEFNGSLKSTAPTKSLSKIFEKIEKGIFSEAQQDFINYASKNGHQNFPGIYGSVTELLVKVIASNFKSFQIHFQKQNSCTNKSCKYVSEQTNFTQSIIQDHDLEDSRYTERGILKKFFYKIFSSLCWCFSLCL